MESDDINLFATIYGGNETTTDSVIRETKNKKRFVPGYRPATANQIRRQKARTGAQLALPTPLRSRDRLELKFDYCPSTHHGLVLGTHSDCDIKLPEIADVSAFQCSITFNEAGQLILHDFGFSAGTRVQYRHKERFNSDGDEVKYIQPYATARFNEIGDVNDGRNNARNCFTWILSAHQFLRDQDPEIIVHIGKEIRLRIVPVQLDIISAHYMDKTKRFRKGCTESTKLMSATLRRFADKMAAKAKNTSSRMRAPLTIQSELGSGSFGTVTHHWNVSNGTMYVVKAPKEGRFFTIAEWGHELAAFQRCSHEHIVGFFKSESRLGASPRLGLEYAPGGCLRNQNRWKQIDVKESTLILRQCLSALTYLQAQNVAHRDIKPDNVVVMWRKSPSDIYVKLCDFGLSKEGSLFSLKGTSPYQAPEVGNGQYYTTNVDVFSVGIMVSSFVLGRGEPKTRTWKEDIIKSIETRSCWSPCTLFKLLSQMVNHNSTLRGTASELYEQAKLLGAEDILQTRLCDSALEKLLSPLVRGQKRESSPSTPSFGSLPTPKRTKNSPEEARPQALRHTGGLVFNSNSTSRKPETISSTGTGRTSSSASSSASSGILSAMRSLFSPATSVGSRSNMGKAQTSAPRPIPQTVKHTQKPSSMGTAQTSAPGPVPRRGTLTGELSPKAAARARRDLIPGARKGKSEPGFSWTSFGSVSDSDSGGNEREDVPMPQRPARTHKTSKREEPLEDDLDDIM